MAWIKTNTNYKNTLCTSLRGEHWFMGHISSKMALFSQTFQTPIKQVSANQLQNISVTDAEDLFGPYKCKKETFLLFDGTYFQSWYRYRYLDSCGGIWVLIHCMQETRISFSPLVYLSMCESSRCTQVWSQIETTSSARSCSSSKFWYALFVVRTSSSLNLLLLRKESHILADD